LPTHAFTIRKLADAAGVGVEAVRYYQRLGLLAEPAREGGGFREYSGDDLRRLRFIKRAQELGFSPSARAFARSRASAPTTFAAGSAI